MYRSTSWYRFAGEYYMNSTASGGQATFMRSYNLGVEGSELPMYVEPESETAKKERRNKFAENAVHVIPVVLLVCALTLWLFSSPEGVSKFRGGMLPGRLEGMTIGLDIETDSDETKTSLLPADDEAIGTKNALLGEDTHIIKRFSHYRKT